MRGIPAVLWADRFKAPIFAGLSHQSVVLHIVRQEQLHLGIGTDENITDKSAESADHHSEADHQHATQHIDNIWVAQIAAPGALQVVLLHFIACPKRSLPRTRRESVEAFTFLRGIGIVGCGDKTVMNLRVGRAVMPEQKRDIDPHTQPP